MCLIFWLIFFEIVFVFKNHHSFCFMPNAYTPQENMPNIALGILQTETEILL